MTYIELINEFWRQDRFKPFNAIDTRLYFLLVNECNVRSWLNPFELPNYELEIKLQLRRKAIGDAEARLKNRGLIDCVKRQNNPTLFTLVNVEITNELFFHRNNRETIGKQLSYNSETIGKHNIEDYRLKTKDYTENNNILLTQAHMRRHTHEEAELAKFDGLLQEILDGKYQIWVEQMRRQHGIEDITEYLASFRDHAIANGKVGSVSNINDFKSYFHLSFRYFIRQTPMEILSKYRQEAKTEKYGKFADWLVSNAPNVARSINPPSEDELNSLVDSFGKDAVFHTIVELDNRADLMGRYFSLYRTLCKWLSR